MQPVQHRCCACCIIQYLQTFQKFCINNFSSLFARDGFCSLCQVRCKIKSQNHSNNVDFGLQKIFSQNTLRNAFPRTTSQARFSPLQSAASRKEKICTRVLEAPVHGFLLIIAPLTRSINSFRWREIRLKFSRDVLQFSAH